MESPVLAAVDGSEESVHAASWAADDAVRRAAPLRLLHAGLWLDQRPIDGGRGDDVQGEARQMLADVAKTLLSNHPGLDIDTRLIHHDSVEGLVSAAADGQLLVLGSRGLGGFVGLLVGSVSLAVSARAETPTVVVRPEHGGAEPSGGEVVLGVDTKAAADRLLEFAFAEAALRGSRLRVVHGWNLPPTGSSLGWVIPPPSLGADVEKAEAEELGRLLQPWRERFPGIDVIEDVRFGGGARALVEVSGGVGLVVVGRRTRTHQAGWHLGPVAHAVLHHAKAPVAVVPHP
ncbi:universal stress protein [Streptacidiphilus sp. PB12-B1b]|uniref:universal stress protein n=1 Tax=Streptacidiphilus sp. PB12-B1b TaxID=2705012 RepID=UPI0015FBF9A2|nr:universal stress protein [Streptacidiphilus sp. PB12-B1b]QMU76804.1 universal stress protein [Streptacidiphilus sp. PB12-B1b]